jgi:transposase
MDSYLVCYDRGGRYRGLGLFAAEPARRPTPRVIRDLRDLTRQRSKLVGERAGVADRVQKVLEDANVKLGSVATDVLGKSGRAMLEALVAGRTDGAAPAELALGRMRSRKAALGKALTGRVTEHHRFLLRLHLDQFDRLEELIERLDERIASVIAAEPGFPSEHRSLTLPAPTDNPTKRHSGQSPADVYRVPAGQFAASAPD